MNKTKYRIFIGLIWMFTVGSVLGSETVYDVRDYGAKADGKTLCTKAIQRAIDECAGDGGRAVPGKPEAYPEYSMFGRLPAYGFYCRHVKGLKLLNVQLQLAKSDQRHGIVLEDVENALIENLVAPLPPETGSRVRMTDVKKVFIRGNDN